MVSLSSVEGQLKEVNCNFRFWGRAEIRELCHILVEGEKIAQAVNGSYESGFAMLVATNSRVMLIDKKLKYLTLKDVRYDMITELDFSHRWMDAAINIHTPNKTMHFVALNQVRLRKLYHFVQERVIESRSKMLAQQQYMEPLMSALGAGLQRLAMPSGNQPESTPADPTFVPNIATYLENIEQLLPAQTAASGARAATQPDDSPSDIRITAYANMPLIMKGWRRRVYGYHSPSYKKRFQGAA